MVDWNPNIPIIIINVNKHPKLKAKTQVEQKARLNYMLSTETQIKCKDKD